MGVEIFKISTPTYKVFTALLTQSGGYYDTLYQTSGSLTIGQTYFINNNIVGADFLNVGAPNNNDGTFFIATGIIPTTWGTGIPEDTLSYFTGTPIVTILENTLGYLWVHYNGVGSFEFNSNGLFTNDKSWVNTVILLGTGGATYRGAMNVNDSNIIAITTESDVDTPSDALLNSTSIEIRVYN
jgi:hypothetical protein